MILKLEAGQEVIADLPSSFDLPEVGASVTAVIRWEHAKLTDNGAGELSGTLSSIVYVGTDTHYYVELIDGSTFVARIQNSRDDVLRFSEGMLVGVSIESNAVQVVQN